MFLEVQEHCEDVVGSRECQDAKFCSEKKKWEEFQTKFMALGLKKGWASALTNMATLNCTSMDVAQVALVEKNDDAYFYLTQAMTRTPFLYVKKHKNDAKKAWDSLLLVYEKKKLHDLTKLQQLYMKSKPLNAKLDPSLWWMELEEMEAQIVDGRWCCRGKR